MYIQYHMSVNVSVNASASNSIEKSKFYLQNENWKWGINVNDRQYYWPSSGFPSPLASAAQVDGIKKKTPSKVVNKISL